MGKKKITWVDDGRTLADMSDVPGSGFRPSDTKSSASFKEKWQTYWSATKMMLLPTLAIAGLLAVIYLIMALVFSAAA